MRGRLLLAAAVAAGTALLAVSPANAQDDYPPEGANITVSPTTIVAGGTVTVTGEGFEPGEDVDITFATTALAAPQLGVDESTQETVAMVPVARTTMPPDGRGGKDGKDGAAVFTIEVEADADGEFTVVVQLNVPGLVIITAVGEESGETATATVTVLGGPVKKGFDGGFDKGKHGLPVTGGNVWRLVWIGGAGTIVGGVLLLTGLAWRARREHADA